MRFEPGDWVWVHMSKKRFLEQRTSKLMPRGDGHYQIIDRINDNAHKVDLLGEYGISVIFSVSDISLFDPGDDSRSNHLRREGMVRSKHQDPLEVLVGLVTRRRAKKFKEAFNGLLLDSWAKV